MNYNSPVIENLMNNVNYNKLTDKQIVERILALPHNEEAAYFLLYVRYFDELNGVYKKVLIKINIQSVLMAQQPVPEKRSQ